MTDTSALGIGIGLRADEFTSDLTFPRITQEHDGNYTCVVANAADQASHSALLKADGRFYLSLSPKEFLCSYGHKSP